MLIAHIQTAVGPVTIGLMNITVEQTNNTFTALLETLSQVTDPIVVTGTDVYLRDAPDDSPATMTFKYLDSSTETFSDPAAYAEAMNRHLSLNIFPCALEIRPGKGALQLTVDFAFFEWLGDESNRPAAVH